MTNIRKRLKDDEGFTLIELLVVILIIGILASIALPNFIGQRTRAFDATTKADVRNVMTQVESCYTDGQDYTKCQTTTDLGAGIGVPFGSGKGQVAISATAADGYTIVGYSKSGSTYTITKASGTWQVARTCTTTAGLYGNAGCPSGTW